MFRPGGLGGSGRDLEDCLEKEIHVIQYISINFQVTIKFLAI